MINIVDLEAGDWQQILLEEIYPGDSDLLKQLVVGSTKRQLNHFEIVRALMDAANRYVDRVNALPELDDGF